MNPPADPGKGLNQYARYSGMAFQMMAIIVAGAFGGLKLDQWLSAKPVFTVILSILSIIFAIYFMVRDLLHRK